MELPAPQLAALVAVVDAGTFEAAARVLHVTPSAVSQRVRALESSVGSVLVRRGTPCVPTAAGRTLVRLGRAQALLADEARAALAPGTARADLSVAVNADSLATWFRPVLGVVAGWDDAVLRLHVEDQGHSHDLLRTGDVLAAVTSDPAAVQGCSVRPLGRMRYVAAATAGLLARHPWPATPVVVFNDKDRLQHELLASAGLALPAAVHRVPTSADILAAVESGLGWGMVPEAQLSPALGRLPGLAPVDVPLFWQRWRLDSPVLDRLTEAVVAAAGSGSPG
jgi:LysR family transcriptional regulator (chromosome initiation inhibitor)